MASETPPEAAIGQLEQIERPLKEVLIRMLPQLQGLTKLGVITPESVSHLLDRIVEVSPDVIFEHADQIIDFPCAQDVMERALKKAPTAALKHAAKYRSAPFSTGVRETAARQLLVQHPSGIFYYADGITDLPCAEEILLKAAKSANPPVAPGGKRYRCGESAILGVSAYLDKPYAEELLFMAVQNGGSWSAFDNASKFIDRPYAKNVLMAAARIYPEGAIEKVHEYAAKEFAGDVLMACFDGGVEISLQDFRSALSRDSGGSKEFNPHDTSIAVIMHLPCAESFLRKAEETCPGLLGKISVFIGWTPGQIGRKLLIEHGYAPVIGGTFWVKKNHPSAGVVPAM